jgi:flagellar hook-length control protein FliK
VEDEPEVRPATKGLPSTNANTTSSANQQQAALPAEASVAAPTDENAASPRPADTATAEKPRKDPRHVVDGETAATGETIPAQATPTGAPKGDATQATDVGEEKPATKATETDAAEPVVKTVPPTAYHDPAGSSRPASAEPSASGKAPAANADATNAADRAQFVERVAGAFRAASQGDGTVRMRLQPPELGSLRLEVSVRDGVLSARLETDTPEARSVLLDHLPALRDRLAQQDIRIERFEVSYQNGSGGSPTGAEDHTASRDGSGRHAPRGAVAELETPRPPRSARAPQSGTGLQLDVMV